MVADSTPRNSAARAVRAKISTPAELTGTERQQLFELMSAHFADVSRQVFFDDLDEKDWLVVLSDSSGELHGFSTVKRRELAVDGQDCAVFISGDTVVDERYWGSMSWLRLWLREVYAIAEQKPALPAYWLLMTATHRSYRFLPGFFREYYPRFDRETPPEVARRIEAFARLKFPDEFDPQTGVIRLRHPTPVRQERASLVEPPADDPHAIDPHVRYFLERNPGYLQSDFLACVTELSRDNLTELGLRFLRD